MSTQEEIAKIKSRLKNPMIDENGKAILREKLSKLEAASKEDKPSASKENAEEIAKLKSRLNNPMINDDAKAIDNGEKIKITGFKEEQGKIKEMILQEIRSIVDLKEFNQLIFFVSNLKKIRI